MGTGDYFGIVADAWWFFKFTVYFCLTTLCWAGWLGTMKMIIRWIRRDGNPVVGDK